MDLGVAIGAGVGVAVPASLALIRLMPVIVGRLSGKGDPQLMVEQAVRDVVDVRFSQIEKLIEGQGRVLEAMRETNQNIAQSLAVLTALEQNRSR